jgi:hypothetical protein
MLMIHWYCSIIFSGTLFIALGRAEENLEVFFICVRLSKNSASSLKSFYSPAVDLPRNAQQLRLLGHVFVCLFRFFGKLTAKKLAACVR